MAISKLKAMMETLEKMEEMQEKVTKDVNKDLNKKRKEALAKIRNYLDEIADSLNGKEITVDIGYKLFCCRVPDIHFNQKYKTHRASISLYDDKYSENPIKWWIGTYESSKPSDDDYYDYIDATNNISRRNSKYWENSFIELIENWEAIKTNIELNLEKELTKQMEKIRKDTAKKIESYEKVNDFEA